MVKLLQNLDGHKAPGPDNIPARLLKDYAIQLAPMLTKIFQKSLSLGVVPTDWTMANVTPIYKKR